MGGGRRQRGGGGGKGWWGDGRRMRIRKMRKDEEDTEEEEVAEEEVAEEEVAAVEDRASLCLDYICYIPRWLFYLRCPGHCWVELVPSCQEEARA